MMEASAIVILFVVLSLVCLSICGHRVNTHMAQRRTTLAAIARFHQQSEAETLGIDPESINAFPVIKYSDVKDIQIGKGTLECAICLSEFSDKDLVRLLPECDHVFHPLCIDKWLACHATCPVCRTNLLHPPDSNNPVVPAPVVSNDVATHIDDDPRSAANLISFDALKEEQQISNESAVVPPSRRSHSTADSEGFEFDKHALALPQDVKKQTQSRSETQRDSNGVVLGYGEVCTEMMLVSVGSTGIRDRTGRFLARLSCEKQTCWH